MGVKSMPVAEKVGGCGGICWPVLGESSWLQLMMASRKACGGSVCLDGFGVIESAHSTTEHHAYPPIDIV
jgi:hypothetical protein